MTFEQSPERRERWATRVSRQRAFLAEGTGHAKSLGQGAWHSQEQHGGQGGWGGANSGRTAGDEGKQSQVNRARGHWVGSDENFGFGFKCDRKPLGGCSEGWGELIRFAKGTLTAVWKTRTRVEARSQLGGYCNVTPTGWWGPGLGKHNRDSENWLD